MKACDVRIFGQPFTLSADMGEEEVRRIAKSVDERMREVAGASPSASMLQVAVLTALDFASEQGRAMGDGPRLVAGDFDERVGAMLRLIDSVDPESPER